MKRMSLLLVALALVFAASLTAAPAAQPHGKALAQIQPLQAPAQPATKAQFLASLDNSAKVCNLLCIQGFHCCIVRGEATCVPETEACH